MCAAAEIAQSSDPPKVVMLTTFDVDEDVHAALRAGAVGFLLKDTPPRDLAAVRTVNPGNAMPAPSVTKRPTSSFAEGTPSQAARARSLAASPTPRAAAS